MMRTKSIMTYDIGDVVLVPFPFTNLLSSKKRPAVVISQKTYQYKRPEIILMAITSQIKIPLGYGECVLSEWQQAGLPKLSMLKPLIATIDQKNILKKLGALTALDQKNLFEVMSSLFDSTSDDK